MTHAYEVLPSLGPDELTEDMTVKDLTYVLEHLSFAKNGAATLRVDREVRDYLLRALTNHAGHRRC
jgi:hypothetical protein